MSPLQPSLAAHGPRVDEEKYDGPGSGLEAPGIRCSTDLVSMKPACFLDRDGVIIRDVGYLSNPDELELIGGAGDAIRRLNDAGIPVVVVSNQSGVARGLFGEAQVALVHERLERELASCDARVDLIHYCPHHPTIGDGAYTIDCECRKPSPGMLRRATAELRLDLPRSFMIGDKLSDLEVAHRAGCRSILVRTGYGDDHDEAAIATVGGPPTWITKDIGEAVDHCLPELIGGLS